MSLKNLLKVKCIFRKFFWFKKQNDATVFLRYLEKKKQFVNGWLREQINKEFLAPNFTRTCKP